MNYLILGLVLMTALLSCSEAKNLFRRRERKINSGWLGFEPDFDGPGRIHKRDDNPPPTEEEPWTGRWMPERTTARPATTEEAWTGRYMPDRVTLKTPIEEPKSNAQFSSNYHETDLTYLRRVSMGSHNKACDDGKTNLKLDWDGSWLDHTCTYPKFIFAPEADVQVVFQQEYIPSHYVPAHVCMNRTIEYGQDVPTYGNHRPVWPKYGEYTYLPKQRWLHNIEHGAVVMLYHPCADMREVDRARKLLTGCLWKHIITPYTKLAPNQSITLVAWGAKLGMTTVTPHIFRNFIKNFALNGPEGSNSNDGEFDQMLVNPAKILPGSDIEDSKICPDQWY